MTDARSPLVRVEELNVEAYLPGGWTRVIEGVSFGIGHGETLGLVGESGCGKTTIAYALFAYCRPGSRITGGRVEFEGRDVLALKGRELQAVRGRFVAVVPQNPAGALTPSMRVGAQLLETLEAHGVATGDAARKRALGALGDVGLPDPAAIARRYPHELSGGQQQRVIIAMALCCEPALLVLDEPTTALDVTTQARIIRLLRRLQLERGMSMLYVTHNLGVVSQICSRVAVMYAGSLVEVAPIEQLFRTPSHPYTRGLLAAVPRLASAAERREALRGLLRREELPAGCRFAPRCAYATDSCFRLRPVLEPAREGHEVACWRWREIGNEERRLAKAPA